MNRRVIVAAVAAVSVSSWAAARPSSTFDTGTDGWTLAASAQWENSGGNGGGYLQGAFNEPTNETAGAFAPAEFLGDWSLYNGVGTLTYDYRRISNGESPLSFLPLSVQIVSPAGNASWTGMIINQPTDWLAVEVPINEAAWSFDGEWADILANVSMLYIQIELVINEAGADDLAGIDNVRLIPSPSAALLALAGVVLPRRRR